MGGVATIIPMDAESLHKGRNMRRCHTEFVKPLERITIRWAAVQLELLKKKRAAMRREIATGERAGLEVIKVVDLVEYCIDKLLREELRHD